GMGPLAATMAAVAEIDRGVDAAGFPRPVGPGEMHGRAMVKDNVASLARDELRRSGCELLLEPLAVALGAEDIDELGLGLVRTGYVAHAARRIVDVDERYPRRHRIGLGNRPIGLVGMRL